MVTRAGIFGQHFGCNPGHFGQHFGCHIVKPSGAVYEIDRLCAIEADANLAIRPRTRGATMLQWDLTQIKQLSKWIQPLEVAIDYAHVGVSDPRVGWYELADYAVRDGVFYITSQLMFGSETNVYFRLRIRSGGGDVHTTQPAHIFNDIPYSQQRAYREFVRRWLLRQQRQEVRLGTLLKRRRWGEKCTECLDRDGGQKIRSQCLTCYDTEFTGGYYYHCDSFGVEAAPQQIAESLTPHGYSQEGPSSAFGFLNIPQVYPGDVWVDWSTDERWLFGNPIVTKSRIGNVELFRTAPVTRLALTDIVYSFQEFGN